MENFLSQSEIATGVVDFTTDFLPLFVGLISMVGLSAAMIFCAALRYYLAQKRRLETDTNPSSTSGRKAA